MKKTGMIFGLILLVVPAFAQMTPEAAVAAALQHQPTIKAAQAGVEQQRVLQRAPFGLPQPVLGAEGTEETNIVLSLTQQIPFPTVFKRQSQVQRQNTQVAIANQALQENELRRMVRLAYLDLQTARASLVLLVRQDSLLRQWSAAADRAFSGGQINALEKQYIALQAGDVNNQLLQARNTEVNALAQLQLLTGLNEPLETVQLTAPIMVSPAAGTSPMVNYYQQQQALAQAQLQLTRAQNLPTLSLGVLYPAIKEDPPLYKYPFRIGIGLPIWFGQNRAQTKAAKLGVEQALQQANAAVLQQQTTQRATETQLNNARQRVEWFEKTALQQAETLLTTSRRLYEGGELDYLNFLRNIGDVFDVQAEYIDALRTLQQQAIEAAYIVGN